MVTWSPFMSSGPGLDAALDPNSPWGGVTGAWLIIVLLPLPFNTVSAARNTFNFDPRHCTATSWPAGQSGPGPGLLRIEVCVVWVETLVKERLSDFPYIYIYTSVCQLKCVSKKIIKRIMHVLEVLCVRLRPKGSNSVLSLQADILIITSLVKWKCEPRKQERAKKDFPLISWLAGLLVVCSAAGLWSAGEGGWGCWTQCPWL